MAAASPPHAVELQGIRLSPRPGHLWGFLTSEQPAENNTCASDATGVNRGSGRARAGGDPQTRDLSGPAAQRLRKRE